MAMFKQLNIKLLLKRVLKAYGLFAACHVLYKILHQAYKMQRVKILWKHLPGKDCDPVAKELMENAVNYHDYCAAPGIEHPEEPLIKLGLPFPELLMNTKESVEWMLKTEFNHITKTNDDDLFMTLLRDFLGADGIFCLHHGIEYKKEHSNWHQQRKVASKIFTKNNFNKLFYKTFVEKANCVLNVLEKNNNKVIDLQALFFSFTMDSIEKFFLGKTVNTVEGGMSDYAISFDNAHQGLFNFFTRTFLMQNLCSNLLPFPFGTLKQGGNPFDSLLFQTFLFFNNDYKSMKKEIAKLDEVVYDFVKQTRNDPEIKSRKDIIANFLNSNIGPTLSDKKLRDIVLNLTIAGRDTTACALSWLFFELTQNPEVQDELCKEIDSKLEGRVPTLAELDEENLPFLHGAIQETLRLHPPVPTDSKQTTKELVYLDGTIIPKDTCLTFSPYAFGRNPKKYKNPLKFDPNRWKNEKQMSLFEFPVFQAGPRFCLGKDMAQMEMKLLTTMILQKFTVSLLEGEAEKIGYTLMITQSISNSKDRREMHLFCKPHLRT